MAAIKPDGPRFSGRIRSFTLILARLFIMAALVLFVLEYIFCTVPMDGTSMEPSAAQGSTVFVNRIAYLWRDPARYDVIAFREKEDGRISVKRIIGLPGETVTIDSGEIVINGVRMIDKSRYAARIDIPGLAAEEIVLGEDEYFVLGDNPARSQDSRFSGTGNVQKSAIVGKAWLGFVFPFSFHFFGS